MLLLPIGAWAARALDFVGAASALALVVMFAYLLLYIPRRGLYSSANGVAVVNAFSVRRIDWCDIEEVAVVAHRALLSGGASLECVTITANDRRYRVGALSRPSDYRTRRMSPALASRRGEFASFESIARAIEQERERLCG